MIEREVENILEQKLMEKGWIIEVGNPKRQVYRQKARTIEENLALKSNGNARFPDFVLYEDNKSEKPIAIIEAKKVAYKNLSDAKEQGLDYAKKLKAKFLFLFNANRIIAYYVPTEENLYIDQVEVEDILSLEILKKFQSNKLSLNEKAEIKSKTDLINVFKIANNKLREAGINAGIARFTEFSNLLFLKLVSELNDDRGYNISKNYLWESYRNMENEVLLGYINDTVIPGLNNLFDSNEAQPLFTP
ncbi:type I restriction enzyme HsdR N-terminal domain-containing protein, partial [Staphylococcus felis]